VDRLDQGCVLGRYRCEAKFKDGRRIKAVQGAEFVLSVAYCVTFFAYLLARTQDLWLQAMSRFFTVAVDPRRVIFEDLLVVEPDSAFVVAFIVGGMSEQNAVYLQSYFER
jgi:hypothetical protein